MIHYWTGYYAVGFDSEHQPILRLMGGQLPGPDPKKAFWELYYQWPLKLRPYPETVQIYGHSTNG